ncbi:type I restriction enzyme HsdR N-terminal domain-containing protein [Bradyrhizobium sp.]|uniref:type I restriction enzyme HsdR N-terminal domain-containing protein n=1 Tax=Bradyrhizobium sp. TaxID=376 RepID=UPI00271ADD9A|nr:type I restriction enzyme HsdR N-terminal domain-containing protein [Bradyrhizobium sp.]MDO9294895.1 type I restriction enzyme HsdR N-terminal domain-containing protein [Bradyrhizobium sp.]
MTDFWNSYPTTGFRSEADVELRLVQPLLAALGYGTEDLESKPSVVFREGRQGRRPEADYIAFYGAEHNRNTSLLVVEAKAPGESLAYGKDQGESYATNVRAPLLLLTNGETLVVWQWQATMESTCVLDIPVSSLLARRGDVERLLAKKAIYVYCRSLKVKNVLEVSRDFTRYETAELQRTTRSAATINRTVRQAPISSNSPPIEADRLLPSFARGALIAASSGYGKTTLALRMFRQAIDARKHDSLALLAFDVPLPDLEQTDVSIIDFMHRRLSPHCPGMSPAALEQLMRDDGVILVCDGFDRVSAAHQNRMAAQFSNLLRDYPLLQMFVLSREGVRPRIELPLLLLEELSFEQMRELERLLLDDGTGTFYSIISAMPDMLQELCKNPLLFNLALDYWKLNQAFPKQIEFLFRSWLDSTLKLQPNDTVSAVIREHALAVIANATTESNITPRVALALIGANGISATAFDELIGCDAIRVNGSVVEVQHEALADYLRAKSIASQEEASLTLSLASTTMAADSFLPVLLMSQLTTHRTQAALWQRLSQTSAESYLNALRYRFDVSEELATLSQETLTYDYLRDFVEGIEMPLAGFFPELRPEVNELLIDTRDDSIAATGLVYAMPGELFYGLHPRNAGPQVTVGLPSQHRTQRSVNLDRSHYRLDSGRLLGMTLLKDTLIEIIEKKNLKGGVLWASERLVGRIRFLAEQDGFPIRLTQTLNELEDVLSPLAGRALQFGLFGQGESFTVDSLLEDIALLKRNGRTALDLWWQQLGWDEDAQAQSGNVIICVLNEHYRRFQQVYAEVVQTCFPAFADQLGFYSSLPVRWKVTVVERPPPMGNWQSFKWLPVESWDQAGADVTFSSEGEPFGDGTEARAALSKLNRLNAHTHIRVGFGKMPSYDGHNWHGYFDGATPVIHDVCRQLADEIKRVFSPLPSNDG